MRLGAISTFAGAFALTAVIAVPAAAQSPDPGGASAPSSQPSPSTTSTAGAGTGSSGVQSGTYTGGSGYGNPGPPQLTVPGSVAKIGSDGYALAPADAPPQVQRAIWAANRIIGLPYEYGGGHNRAFASSGYDCSGTVSFALHGGRLLGSPLDSTSFESWGMAGPGQWISVYANVGHAYVNIAGIRLDTSSADDPTGRSGPRWRPLRHSNAGYRVRHPKLL